MPQVLGIAWLPVVLGLLVLYLPTFYDLGRTLWQTEEQSHAPLILAASAWLFWQRRQRWLTPDAAPRPVLGGTCLLAGLLCYVIGRSQDVILLETGSLIPVLAGTLLVMQGMPALRACWFPLLYSGFMIPLPGILIDTLTGPLKAWISVIVESLLYQAGYPIARIGVILSIGQYQLQVADACSGLNSMLSLSALGLFFMYVTGRTRWLHNAIMLASLLPIAVAANIIRVILLVLVTYHQGDAAGQGFLHGFSGIALLIVALLCLFSLDSLLAKLIKP